jgi:hypothetical protein
MEKGKAGEREDEGPQFLRSRIRGETMQQARQRPLGLLKGKATCQIGEDFSITDEELLQL